MCPLLFVRLSVRRAFACVHQRRCLASAPAMATATATTMTMTVTPAMGLSPAMTLSLRVHVLTVAWRRFQLCSLLLRSFSPSPLGCYLFAHIFFKFCHKNWFMWLPQNVCFLSHSTQTLAPTGFPAPASTGLPLSLVLVSSAFSQCTLPCLSTGWCWFVNLKSGSRAKFLHFLAHWKLGYIFTRFIG